MTVTVIAIFKSLRHILEEVLNSKSVDEKNDAASCSFFQEYIIVSDQQLTKVAKVVITTRGQSQKPVAFSEEPH